MIAPLPPSRLLRNLFQLLTILLFTLGVRVSNAQQYDLVVPVPIGDNTNIANGRRIVTDPAGNMYIAGTITGTLAIGPTPAVGRSGGFYVAKLSPTGTWLWAAVSTGNSGFVKDLAIDATGNLYITGEFMGPTLQLGPVVLTNANPNTTSRDVYVAKLDPNGQWLWATRGGNEQDELSTGLALTRTGAVYITGTYSRPGTQFGTTRLPVGPEPSDVYVAMLDPQGQWAWAVRGGQAAGSIGVSDIAVDGQDNAYIAGEFSNTVRFGPYRLQNVSLSDVPADLFVAKINPAGTWLSAIRAGGLDSEWVTAMDVDRAGNVYITGGVESSTINFGSISLSSTNTGGNVADVFVAELGSNGQWQWAVQGGGTRLDYANRIVADRFGNCYITGLYYSQPPTFGSFVLPAATLQPGIFTAKVSLLGQWDWAIAAGGPGEAIGFGVAYANQRVYTTGSYTGFFLTLPTFGTLTIPNAVGYIGGWVARLLSPEARVQGDTITCNNTPVTLTATATEPVQAYRWNTGATTPSITVAQPGTYYVTTTFSGGQTSTAVHQLTSLTPTVRITGDSLLCSGSTTTLSGVVTAGATLRWSTGATTPTITVQQPGTYSLTASYSTGCAVTKTVTVRALQAQITGIAELCSSTSTTTLTATAPGATAYTWSTGATTPSILVSQTGSYTVRVTHPNGCVSVATQTVAVPTLSVRGDSLLCANAGVSLQAVAAGATAYVWNTGATTATIQPTQPGTYSVQARFASGCVRSAQFRVRAIPSIPLFSLGPDTTLCAQQAITLRLPETLQSSDYSYVWSTGARTDELTVSTPGTYSVQISSACGTRQISRTISTNDCLTIPNIITPNGDEYNELFVVKGLTGTEWSLEIFNRWGTQVYASPSYRNDWGTTATAGVYFYSLRHVPTGRLYKGWLQVAP